MYDKLIELLINETRDEDIAWEREDVGCHYRYTAYVYWYSEGQRNWVKIYYILPHDESQSSSLHIGSTKIIPDFASNYPMLQDAIHKQMGIKTPVKKPEECVRGVYNILQNRDIYPRTRPR